MRTMLLKIKEMSLTDEKEYNMQWKIESRVEDTALEDKLPKILQIAVINSKNVARHHLDHIKINVKDKDG
jgi:hypothetical protein